CVASVLVVEADIKAYTPVGQLFITVTNKRSYDTFRDRLIITIDPPVQEEIRQDMMRMWKTDRLDFVNITSALDRGGRVPLPLAGHYEGVYVKVGSDQYFSECLLRLQTAEHRRQCEAGGRAKIPGDCKVCSYPGNCVTWCKSTLIDLSGPVVLPPAPTMGPGILDAGGVYDPPESPPPRDFLPDYIVTVIVPLALAIILCLLLAYIMCCRREGVIQLYHHHTIHGNTSELRSMAGGRGVPPPLSTLSMFNVRTGETAPPFQTDSTSIPLILAQQEINTDTLPRK
ncbi:unnamed protein product, partial [Coregonus sp. 'balchen']